MMAETRVTGKQLLLRGVVSQQRGLMIVQVVHLIVQRRILSGSVDSELKATADNIKTDANKPMEHACGGEYSPDNATKSHQELPQRHMLLADRHHQRAGVILHKDAGHTVTACRVVYHPLPLSHGKLVRVCRYLVCVESGGHHCDEVLEHLVVVIGDFLCAIQRIDDAWYLLPKR